MSEQPKYSAEERALILAHRKDAQAKARAAVKAAGITINPKIAKARRRKETTEEMMDRLAIEWAPALRRLADS